MKETLEMVGIGLVALGVIMTILYAWAHYQMYKASKMFERAMRDAERLLGDKH